jgi:hypothetical protein
LSYSNPLKRQHRRLVREVVEVIDLLECAENLTESRDIGSDELIGSRRSNPSVEVDDFVERRILVEVEIVDVSSETSSERESEFRLKETEHRIGVDRRNCEKEPVEQAS